MDGLNLQFVSVIDFESRILDWDGSYQDCSYISEDLNIGIGFTIRYLYYNPNHIHNRLS